MNLNINKNDRYFFAYEQFKNEGLGNQKDFDKEIQTYGYNYITYYNNRHHEALQHVNSFDPESY
jgi:hypothetical protein